MTQPNEKPLTELRAGAISATISEKTVTQDGRAWMEHTILILKHYKDHGGTWRTSTFLKPDELPKLALVATKAYELILLRQTQRNPNSFEAGAHSRGTEETEAKSDTTKD